MCEWPSACPVCRYELETSDTEYESKKRRAGGSEKKLYRYTEKELGKLSIKQLKEVISLNKIACDPRLLTEKRDFVELISKSGKVEMITEEQR